jgi:hypothetical protein
MKNHLSLHIYLYPRLLVFFILNTLFVTRGQPPAGPETARLSTAVAMARPTKREGSLSLFILTMETTSLLLACPSFSPSQGERPCSFFLVNKDNYFLHMQELMGNQTRSMKDSKEDFVSCTQWRLLSSSSSRCQWIQASVFPLLLLIGEEVIFGLHFP